MKVRPAELQVFLNDARVGTLYDATPLAFEYDAAWLEGGDRSLVGRIPRAPGRQDGPEVTAFFDNLLPEGDLRAYLSRKHQASTVFGLLLALGGDSVGAFVLLPPDEALEPSSYEPTTWKRLGRELAKQGVSAVDVRVKDARISLSGAQDKATLALDAAGKPYLPRGYSPSTHILKPDIQRIRGVFASAANEVIVMRTAHIAGLDVAATSFEPHTRSCLVRRFDRIGTLPDPVQRLVQYDFCQLSGITSAAKYEAEGGPGLRRCAEIIREQSVQPAVDLRRLVDWVFFNLYVGNNDGHAKNLSIFTDAEGARLTPFYDLMSTRVYPTLSSRFALAIGGEYVPRNLARRHIEAMAGDLGMRVNYVIERAEALSQALPEATDQAITGVEPDFNERERQLASKVRKLVRSTTRSLSKSILGETPAKTAPRIDESAKRRRRLS